MPRPILTAACAMALALPAAAQDEASFDSDWRDVQRLIAREQWFQARSDLEKLIDRNAQQLYVLAAREALVEDHKRCCFHLGCRQPRPEDLISGELLRWDPASGFVVLRYRSDRMQDFEAIGSFLLHPATFNGSYTVTISGTYPREGSVQVVYDVAGESWCLADWGGPALSRTSKPAGPIGFYRGNGQQQPSPCGTRARSPAEPGKSFTLSLQAGRSKVELYYQQKQQLATQRDAPQLFRLGIGTAPMCDLTIEGQVEPAWLQGLIDQKLSDLRVAFEQGYRPEQRLPAWLFERPRSPRTAPMYASDLPGDGAAIQAALGPALLQFTAGDYVACMLALDRLPADAAPGPARDFLQAASLLRVGEPSLALRPCERALQQEPTFTPLRLLHADLLAELRRSQQALAEMRAALQDDPGEPRIYERLVPHLLRHGAVDEAERVVRMAKSRHGLWDEMTQLDRMVAMAARGPGWHRRFSSDTQHYEIVSDIDARVCVEAGRILEELHRNLHGEFGGGEVQRPLERMRVFLFSGQAGYQDYCRQILGNAVPHTGGLYSPVLKQLLIWNLPSREAMERTIRHEGCHQFLDRLMESTPTWFDEGLAQFYEDGKRVQGRLEGGEVDPAKLAVLRQREGLPRLRELVYGSRGDFYRSAQKRYPHAWALVHFLRRSTTANRNRFATLWDELKKGAPAAQALDLAFQGLDWEAFEAEFWTYVGSLGHDLPAQPR